jgi:hypothetical protein
MNPAGAITLALCTVFFLGARAAQPPFFNALECDVITPQADEDRI